MTPLQPMIKSLTVKAVRLHVDNLLDGVETLQNFNCWLYGHILAAGANDEPEARKMLDDIQLLVAELAGDIRSWESMIAAFRKMTERS